MIRPVLRAGIWLLLAGVALAGCSSGGDSSGERLRPILEETIFGGPIFGDAEPLPQAPALTRAQLNEIPFATIAVISKEGQRAYVVPLADNGGYLVYQDALRRGIVMRGGLITATQGLTYNLAAVRHALDDPIVTALPVAEWPGQINRNYQFTAHGGARDYQITTSCTYEPIGAERIEIVELFLDVLRIEETCMNAVRSFTNTYWADVNTGFIWRSEQWIGPRQDPMTIEIIRRYRAE